MSRFTSKFTASLPVAVPAFVVGIVVFGLFSGVFTGSVSDEIASNFQLGYEQGYDEALQLSPALDTQQTAINIFTSAVFMERLEIEIKSIARLTNAIEFTYGEKGGERIRVAALHVGDAIARRMGNNLYIIKNVSVSANLQRATVEVTRINQPTQKQATEI